MRLIVVLFFVAFACTGQESETIDFDKLFSEQKKKSAAAQVLERKTISQQDAQEARDQTEGIQTPMTLIGKGTKYMFTCEDCSKPGNFISVNFEGVCGIAGCLASNLKVRGGPGDFSASYNGAASGSIQKGYNGLAGGYQWSATLDDKYHCSGTFRASGEKMNITIYAYSKCSNPYYNEF